MNDVPPTRAKSNTALLLTGGGARAAYQVGVLQGLAALQRQHRPQTSWAPFGIIVGTSAGAINAAAVATDADRFRTGIARLTRVWGNFHAEQVYQASTHHALAAALRWFGMLIFGWAPGGGGTPQPRSLLNNEPLRQLLENVLPLQRLPKLLASGHLQALAVTTSNYSSGEHITFYDGSGSLSDWERPRRRAVYTTIGVEHLMASAAIPFLFPATRIVTDGHPSYHGDGSMRQIAPISPVIHLGAERVLVIGVGGVAEASDDPRSADPGYPSLAQVANHALSSIFLDTLAGDAERLHRINHTLTLIDPARRSESNMRPIDLLVITPSTRIDGIAVRHTANLPPAMRGLLGMLGMRGGAPSSRSSALAAYLLFEGSFTRELMRLGRADAMARQDEIIRFFGWDQKLSRDQGQHANMKNLPVHDA